MKGILTSAQETEDEGINVSDRLFSLLILGVAFVFVGIVILAVVSLVLGGSGSVGVVIFIGPFPVVFGSGPSATWLILIGIVIAVLSVAFFLVMNKRLKEF